MTLNQLAYIIHNYKQLLDGIFLLFTSEIQADSAEQVVVKVANGFRYAATFTMRGQSEVVSGV